LNEHVCAAQSTYRDFAHVFVNLVRSYRGDVVVL
jgi:hypothetical protein